ncbi:MAG TPA: hypothetical protein VMW08_02825 [Acidimicrobiales bacterium]|nr:hypothetical protein [Acidimicrobiales bacterium]
MTPTRPAGSRWWDPPGLLVGINLRSWAVLQLADDGGVLDMAELVERVERAGFTVEGRPSKTISDALRWEVARGRVLRLARGRYACGRLAKVTKHRMQRRLEAVLSRAGVGRHAEGRRHLAEPKEAVRVAEESFASVHVVALMRNQTTPPPFLAAARPSFAPP